LVTALGHYCKEARTSITGLNLEASGHLKKGYLSQKKTGL
jgi:hypothetical protein